MKNDSIENRKRRWGEFYTPSSRFRSLFKVGYTEYPPRPQPHSYLVQQRIEWAWTRYQELVEQGSWLHDDTVPFLDVYTGTEIFAEAFGCRVHEAKDQMPFATPLIDDAGDVAGLKIPDLSSPPLKRLFTIADALRSRAGEDAVVRLPDIQSPMDICALIWRKDSFFVALVDNPAAVHELADKVMALLTAFLDKWFGRYGTDFIAHYPTYYVPHGVTLSEDEIGAISSSMCAEHFLPELSALSERYGRIGIHCCADARHQWRNIERIPNLMLLNLGQPNDVLQEAYPYFSNHTTQMHRWCGDGDLAERLPLFPKTGRIVYRLTAETREEAEGWSSQIEKDRQASVLN